MTLLTVDDLAVVYDRAIPALRGLSLAVRPGEVVALLGANGAGRSTTLAAIAGLVPTRSGTLRFDGADITHLPATRRVRNGIATVLEGRRVFGHLTVHENLLAGGYTRGRRADTDRVYRFLPRLGPLRGRTAGYLSGGEQQLLAIGRALMSEPRLLLLDEPTLGLGPIVADEVYAIVRRLNTEFAITVLLVEHNAARALRVADRGYVLEHGRVVLAGGAAELARDQRVRESYLGVSH